MLFSSLFSKAQILIGFEGGYNLNFVISDISNRVFEKKESRGGYQLGIKFKYDLSTRTSLLISPGLIQKNYGIRRTGRFEGVFTNYSNLYAQLPISFQFNLINKRTAFYLNSGIYLAYWVTASVEGTTPNTLDVFDTVTNGQISEYFRIANYNDKYNFNSQRDNRIEFGLTGGFGVSYKLPGGFFPFLEIEIFQSLTDLQKKYMVQRISKYNQSYLFSFGCLKTLRQRKELIR